jgi:hypothetical protein
MPRTFTLDTNCLIAVANNEPAAGAVRALADAHTAGRADVAVVAMSASEKQRGGHYIHDFTEFRNHLVSLGLGHLNVILPMMYWDISFWGHCLWSDDAMVKLEHEIHLILFPTMQFLWEVIAAPIALTCPTIPQLAHGAIANVTFRPSGAIFITSGTYSSQATASFTRPTRKRR